MAALRSMLITAVLLLPLLGGGVACTGETESPDADRPADRLPQHPRHTDHSSFFQAPFPDGPSVTLACLECHPDAAAEVMATAHWNWQGEEVIVPGHEGLVRIGKRNVINNFCIGIQSNWPACTMCHIGYGWEDENFDFTDQTRVDCLVCHDNSGTYLKKFRAAGVPDESVDLLTVARSVGMPLRQNCGSCHFQGGGGNAIKHGDMDETLLFPSSRIDVHMGKYDMHCVDCHRTEKHQIRGRSMAVSVDNKNFLRCTDCHDPQPHSEMRLNSHTNRVACQACHVPYMAPDTGTKMTWDWSEAGQDLDITDGHQYLKIKGRFTWAKKVKPEYYWYNETSTRYITGDKIDPSKPTKITGPLGNREDPKAKIWPFKVHRGRVMQKMEARSLAELVRMAEVAGVSLRWLATGGGEQSDAVGWDRLSPLQLAIVLEFERFAQRRGDAGTRGAINAFVRDYNAGALDIGTLGEITRLTEEALILWRDLAWERRVARAAIDEALGWPITSFRPPTEKLVGLTL